MKTILKITAKLVVAQTVGLVAAALVAGLVSMTGCQDYMANGCGTVTG